MLGKFDEMRSTAFISTMPLDSFPVDQKTSERGDQPVFLPYV
jgi:hypothetical protein